MHPHSWPAVLVTGMSGTGKSTALAELGRRGHRVVDTDDPGWIEVVGAEPRWREDAIRALLAEPRDAALFVQGTVANQGRFYPVFDAVVLLSAPLEVMLERVSQRTNNPFGKADDERERIVRDTASVEPLLRASATAEIDTRVPVREVADQLERWAARGR